MAQIVLQTIGAAVGRKIGGSIGALILSQVGSYVGGRIDQQIFGGGRNAIDGPRLTENPVMQSVEGSPMSRLWGRHRLGGELVWTTRFKETVRETRQGGGKGGASSQSVTTREYLYSCSFAVAFCEGSAHTSLGRIWANGILLDQSKFSIRFYPGSETQTADALIVAKEGTAPAFRGVAYVVFEDMALADFGNVIPQISAEIIKPIFSDDPAQLENALTGVTLIPASGEFAYGVTPYVKTYRGATDAENVHTGTGDANMVKSLDALKTQLPNVAAVTLVASWFGDDLRCGVCTVRPKVETQEPKAVRPRDWRVSGLTRTTAQLVSSLPDGSQAYGGTPSDDTLYDAIVDLKARGKQVVFYPFIMMDVAQGNTKPNPYSANAATAGQPAYPWRGRVTCSPAAGFAGTVDKTATAATQVASFFGSATAGHFAWNASAKSVDYSGPSEWGLRRQVLHYARLCQAAGGVDAFIIGAEMVGLTTVRSAAGTYPAVAQLQSLAAEVRAIVGAGCKITYAADWSEYHSHRPADGSNDVYFHLDPLWADANIDAIGIDNYMPLADWRDGGSHLDAALGGPYDRGYLQANIEGGEYFAWYYQSQAHRDAQTRTTISDGLGKPWVYRNKDMRGWWLNQHFNRPGGTEAGSPTGWVPQSKPIWFTELGCGAIDKGANAPNLFLDPKSSESFAPPYSSGARDDLAQRRFLEAHLAYWSPAAGNNPTSTVYGGRMIDVARIAAWTWDARPYPEFPQRADIWGDSANYRTGHWLNGRVGIAPLADLVRAICALKGLGSGDIDVSDLQASEALVTGFSDSRNASPRELLTTLADIYLFDAFESDGKLKFVRRGAAPVLTLDPGDFIVADSGEVQAEMKRGQDIDLPRQAVLRFHDEDNAFQAASVTAQRLTGASQNEPITVDAPLVLTQSQARAIIEAWLYEAWAAKETAEIELPPSLWKLDAGDVVTVPWGGRNFEMRLAKIDTGNARKTSLVQVDARVYSVPELFGRPARATGITIYGPPEVRFLDLPMLADDATAHQPYVAAYATPWPGAVNFYRKVGASFDLNAFLPAASIVGETAWGLYKGPTGRWDEGNTVALLSYGGALTSIDELGLFAGGNTIAIENADGEWEALQFLTATLHAPNTYVISRLLRGQLGTERAMRNPVAPGARWALLDRAKLKQLDIATGDRGAALTWRYGPATEFHDAASYTEVAKTFNAIGLRPYSPAQIRGRWLTNGDAVVTWIRRTRVGGDDWEALEVPLAAPDLDVYDIEIMSGATVKRTFSAVSGPSVTYTAAQQTADFGAPQWNFTARIYQLSSTVGRGSPWEGLVYPTLFG